MQARVRRVAIPAGIVGVFTIAAILVIGCGGISPFLATQFANTLTGGLASGGPDTSPPDDGGVGQAIDSVCDLPERLRGISVTVSNESQQYVKFSMTFAVSAGSGGFVCDEEYQDYINAGYGEADLTGNTTIVGCDTLTLLGGNKLLTMEFGISEGANATLDPASGTEENPVPTTYQLTRRDNGSEIIPLPEIIVLGNEDPNFICTGGAVLGDLCSQRGFVYFTQAGVPTGKPANVSRIQGTVCNSGFGTAPEWRLDKTVEDDTVQPYQYAAGGAIVVTVLDRDGDAPDENRNQAVWLVTDGDGNTIHNPAP
ncbi:MAG: hypothetical protein JXQ75_13220 [Phycisphaerae bacterium]|nr:hypothetical protein [Phycisphaerae bacterium]